MEEWKNKQKICNERMESKRFVMEEWKKKQKICNGRMEKKA